MPTPRALAIASLLGTILLGLPGPTRAEVKLPAIFSDHMVLQEGRKVPFWGTSKPGETITVSAAGATATAVSDQEGRWVAELPPLEQNEPFTVTIKGENTVTFSDVVTGEVWIASGQSNMEWPLVASRHGDFEVDRAAAHANLRLFRVARPGSWVDPGPDVTGQWSRASADSAALFSAVGYYFGRELLRSRKRPVGIIQSAWGGTPAEAWTNARTLAANPTFKAILARARPDKAMTEEAHRTAQRTFEEQTGRFNAGLAQVDAGNQGETAGWAAPATDLSGFRPVVLPATFEELELGPDGAVWFRKAILLPGDFVGKALTLRLGSISDCDVAYVNGQKVGATCKETSQHELWPRRYQVPAALTKTGRVVIAVRIFDERGKGGFLSKAPSLRLVRGEKADDPAVSLAGEWLARVEQALTPKTGRPEDRPQPVPGLHTHTTPGILYQHMLAPLIPFSIRGVIWYQGESNTKRAHQYRTLFPAMIADWRKAWNQGDFPFLYVQLAPFHPRFPGVGQRSEDEWAELREAQLLTLKVPATGMVVTTDIGDPNDIHPLNKYEVGRRLALVALGKVYGQEIAHSGPVYLGHKTEPGKLRLRFGHAAGLAVAGGTGDRLVGFEVAGSDRRFVAADATIEGDSVVLAVPDLRRPVAARYGWTDAPIGNLVNDTGLPASPFRTDRWPGLTVNRK